MPKVSVIVATYNRCEMLKEAIDSVLAQTFHDWELIIVDDGSRDQTAEVVLAYAEKDKRIKFVRQTNAGCAAARNTALSHITGAYVAFLDDDDTYLPGKLEKQAGYLDANPNVYLVYSEAEVIDKNNMRSGVVPKIPKESFAELLIGFPVPPTAMLVRRECFDKVGGFCTQLRSGDDLDMWLRISRVYGIVFLPGKVALYKWHDTNLTLDEKRLTKSMCFILKRLLRENLSDAEHSQVFKAAVQFTYHEADDRFTHGHYKEALFYYGQALEFSPFIGDFISWSRFRNRLYRLIKPYIALVYCWVFSILLPYRGEIR